MTGFPAMPLSDPANARHCRGIATWDGIVKVHPAWWVMPSAILKGWIDRILRPGIALRFAETDTGEGIPQGPLIAGTVLVFYTSNTPLEREEEVSGDPPDRIGQDCIVSFCGVRTFRHWVSKTIVTSAEKHRRAWLAAVQEIARKASPPVFSPFPESFSFLPVHTLMR